MSASRRFPPPWSVEERDDCFVVRDRNGRALHYIHFKHDHGCGSSARLFTREEAKHIAANFARLPELLISAKGN
jgi:hypothetical protein